jgi:acyl carrier protein
MAPGDKSDLREFLRQCLATAGDRGDLDDGDSLFLSGRLDSLAMTNLVVFLENAFGVDFGQVDFDVELLDSVSAIEELVGRFDRVA